MSMSLTAAIRREYIYITSILRTLWLLREVTPNSSRTIVDIVEGFARRTPHAPAVYFQDEVMSYAQLDARANRYANWAIGQGIKQGDCVALLMENRPDFLCCWLGLFKAGAAVALINTNQRLQPLAHSIQIAGARQLIVGSELAACVTEAEAFFDQQPQSGSRGRRARPIAAIWMRRWTQYHPIRRARDRAPACAARTAPFISIPPAPPACPRRPISAIRACCS